MSRICAVLAVLSLLAAVSLAADKTPVTDDALYNLVRIRLADDPVVKGGNLQVDVKQGVITLRGTVETEAQREKATKAARKVKGVKQVINNIEIKNKAASK